MEDLNNLPWIISQMHELNNMHVVCGVLNISKNQNEDYIEMIAMVNEHGADIIPKSTKYLTIPTPNAGKHRASDFDGLFFYITKSGHPSLALNNNGQLKVMFLLKTSVHIPQRSYFRASFDNHINSDWYDAVIDDVQRIEECRMTAKELYQHLGRLMVNEVQKSIYKFNDPKNAPITIANKGKDNPLVDTGALYRSIGYEVIPNS